MRRLDRVGGTATILVTDLVGSTAMFDRLGDEKAERLLRSHLGELRAQVGSFGGVEVKSTGDGIMAAFPAAWLATECAVAMQRAVHLRNEEGAEVPLHIRLGLHSGDTTADRHDYYGIAVAVAARLCDQAPADGILVSGVTRGLVGSRGGHVFTDAGMPPLKGIDEPVRAWALQWGPGQLPPAPPPGLERRRGPLLAGAAAAVVILAGGALFLTRGGDDAPRPVKLEAPGDVVRVSVRKNGKEMARTSSLGDISASGSHVAYASATKTLNADSNETTDVFRVALIDGDVIPRTLELLSAGADGVGDGASTQPSVSDDGSVVGFLSDAKNLAVKEDGNRHRDVFVHSDGDGVSRVSIGTNFEAADGPSYDVQVSGDGRLVAFTTAAQNLAFQGDFNEVDDIFVRDLDAEKTNRVNIRSGTLSEANERSFGPELSQDGQFVAFSSFANDLTPPDTNNRSDVFRYDRTERETLRASLTSDRQPALGDSSEVSISNDGSLVAFVSDADNLVDGDDEDQDVFVHDFSSGRTTLVSAGAFGESTGNGDSRNPSISGDGRYVAFDSEATNLVRGDENGVRDVFLYDLTELTMTRLSLGAGDVESDADSFDPSITFDGQYVVFTSRAALVEGDNNLVPDVYLRGPLHD